MTDQPTADSAREDEEDAVLIRARQLLDTGHRTPLDDVLAQLGYTREQIDALPDDDTSIPGPNQPSEP